MERTDACSMSTTLPPPLPTSTEPMVSFLPPIRSLVKRDVNVSPDWDLPRRLPMTLPFYEHDYQHHTGGRGQGHDDTINTNDGFKGFNVNPTQGGFRDKFGPELQPTKNKKPHGKVSTDWHDEPTVHNETKWVSCGNFSSYKDYSEVVCTPLPNAFNPCEDVMGYEWLRVLVWFVLLAALCGNLVVMIVLVTARSKLTVPKFLMCNLSFADFLMGLYLLLIASVDIHSLGEYFTHAVTWQNDGGCQVAGFLTVFSSELSVFVLTVITLERWYAISQAIHINKRLRMRQASFLMIVGWFYASSMGLLPLFGVSGYGAVSMCLPMEAKDVWDKVYIVALLVFNGCAFVAICGCYISMFMKVRASENMARSNDATIAKRMAILVLTNFICWAPIAFFGLTASFGLPLIDITKSKILLVFFYPFNSCANPFLYAILTKQFRRDVFILLGRHGICTERANRYKGTTMSRSYSNSRNNGVLLNAVHNTATDVSLLSQYSKFSKGSISLNGITGNNSNTSGTPKVTPQGTPQDTPCTSPKVTNSPVKEGPPKPPVFFSGSSSTECRVGKNERKLSTVIETSHASDGPSDDCATYMDSNTGDERILEGRDSLRDLFDGNPHGRVRSASEYVVIFRASNQDQKQQHQHQVDTPQQQQDFNSTTRAPSQNGSSFERQASRDTVLSSNTLSSLLSDSSSSRLDSDNEIRLTDRKIFPVGSNDGSVCPEVRNEYSEKNKYPESIQMKPRKNYSFLPDLESCSEAESLLNQNGQGVANGVSSPLINESISFRDLANRDSLMFFEEQLQMAETEKDKVRNGCVDKDKGHNQMGVGENKEMNQNYISGNANKDGQGVVNTSRSLRPSCLTSHRGSSPDRRVSFCDDVKSGRSDKKKLQQSESKGRISLFKRNGKR